MDINKELFEFLMGFYQDKCQEDYNATYKNAYGKSCTDCSFELALCQWASDKAYRDVCRTITFIDKSSDDKETSKFRMQKRIEATKTICEYIGNLNKHKKFDVWHREVCDGIRVIYRNFVVGEAPTPDTLNYGQVQKWLNMTIKWLWMYNSINKTDYFDGLMFHETNLHIPLDSFIIDYAKNKKGKGYEHTKKLTITTPWSRINDYDEYVEYQQKLREIIKEQEKVSPLEWELVHWKNALNMNISK